MRDIPLAPGALPLLGHAVTLLRDPLAFLRSLAGRADAVRLRLGPAEVVLVCDGELTRAVLADDRVFDKGGPIFDRVRDLVGEGLSACAHDTHRRLRPLVQPAFHRSRLPRYGELMAARQAEVIGGWHDGQILNIPPQMEYLAAATLVDTLFTDSIPAHQIPPFITDVHTLVTGITWRVMLPPWLTRLPLPPARHYTDANNRLYHLVESIVATRRTAPESNHHDLIAGLLRASSPNRTDQVRDHITPEDGRHDPTDGPLHGGSGNCPADPVGELRERITPEERRSDPIDPPLRAGSRNRLGDPSAPLRNRITPGETVDQIVTFLIAGAITAADTLSWALAELATKPELQQRLRTEVDAVVGRGGTASPVHVAGLDLTARTITETLRRYPPTWLLTRRTTEDSHLGSRALPAGTTVAFSPYLLHHHPAYYPNPETFDPDRWLTPSPAPYLPFGDGPRRCIGDHFATLETTLALATITARWHLRLYQPDPPRPARSIGLTPHHLRIHLTAR